MGQGRHGTNRAELPRPESANCPIFLWRRAGVKWPRPLCRPLDRCRPGALSNAVPACGVALISSSGPATRTQSMCQCEQCGRKYADHRPKGLSCISGAARTGGCSGVCSEAATRRAVFYFDGLRHIFSPRILDAGPDTSPGRNRLHATRETRTGSHPRA